MTTVKFSNWTCDVAYAIYENGRLAIQLMDAEDHSPVATATVNLPDVDLDGDEVAIKDYSENAGMLDALIEAGVVSKPRRYEATCAAFTSSGFVTVPICQWLDKPLNLEDLK